MNYKIALIFGIVLFTLEALDARKDVPQCSNCKYLGWRPLKRIFKRQELKRHHYRQQQAARIQKYIANRKPKAVQPKDDLKSTLKSNIKMIQDAFLSNLREDNVKANVKPNVRSRREKKIIEITRKHKYKRPWIKIRERWSNKIYKEFPPKPTLPPPTEPPNEALLIVKNLQDLTTNAKNLARKGFEALYKALDD